ncbi:hypothetical protein UlMin_024978 [Ulmus minor]
MELSFETEHPAKPLYGVVDERTFQLYMHHAQQDAIKYSLLVTGERRAEEVCTSLVEPYCNVPLIPFTVDEVDEEGSGFGGNFNREDGIYGQGGILGDIEENRVFRSKKELMTCLSIMSMRKKFQYKVFKSNTRFIVVRCVHPSCSWRYWMVTKHVNKHTCPTDFKTTRRRQATSWVVRECIKRRFINPGRVFRPRDVMDDMKQRYGVELSYSVAWRGRDINATHLKGKYRGVLFTAVCHDANQQIFPLAIGVGDSENDAAWTWFLKRVKDVFGENPALVIVSDRHRSIRSAVEEAFPRAFHGICIYHLLNNLKTKFKLKNKELEQHYIPAAKSYNLQEFHVLFYTLCSAVPGAKEYLESVGLDRWTRSHAPCRRYNIMTTNISESFNAVLVKVRELPITAFVNEVRLLCQRWFQQRRTKVNGCSSRMSTDVENKLEQRRDRAQTMDVICADQYTFDVLDGDHNYCVDMALWTCTCRKFQLDQLPCDHVLAVVRKTQYDPYDLCSLYYTR